MLAHGLHDEPVFEDGTESAVVGDPELRVPVPCDEPFERKGFHGVLGLLDLTLDAQQQESRTADAARGVVDVAAEEQRREPQADRGAEADVVAEPEQIARPAPGTTAAASSTGSA